MLKGMDVSALPMLEAAGARYYGFDGRAGDLMDILASCGVDLIRVRAFVEPYDEQGKPYGAGTNDTKAAVRLLARAKERGMRTLLCLQYSDFWADPGKQFIPKAWRGLSLPQMENAVEMYTRGILDALDKRNARPDMVQIGNEITGGLLYPLGQAPDFVAIARLTNAGARAASRIPVMLHIDRGGDKKGCEAWIDQYLAAGGRAPEAIGLSYYPFWHGGLDALSETLALVRENYHLPAYVVETAYPHSSRDYLSSDAREKLPLGMTMARETAWPFTESGQAAYTRALLQTLEQEHAAGFCWWEPEWLPLPGCGWATAAALQYLGLPPDTSLQNEWANNTLFDYDGHALSALKIIRDEP